MELKEKIVNKLIVYLLFLVNFHIKYDSLNQMKNMHNYYEELNLGRIFFLECIFHHFDKYNFANNLYLSKYSPLFYYYKKIQEKNTIKFKFTNFSNFNII